MSVTDDKGAKLVQWEPTMQVERLTNEERAWLESDPEFQRIFQTRRKTLRIIDQLTAALAEAREKFDGKHAHKVLLDATLEHRQATFQTLRELLKTRDRELAEARAEVERWRTAMIGLRGDFDANRDKLAAASALLERMRDSPTIPMPWRGAIRAHLSGQPAARHPKAAVVTSLADLLDGAVQPAAPSCECSPDDLWQCGMPGCPANKPAPPDLLDALDHQCMQVVEPLTAMVHDAVARELESAGLRVPDPRDAEDDEGTEALIEQLDEALCTLLHAGDEVGEHSPRTHLDLFYAKRSQNAGQGRCIRCWYDECDCQCQPATPDPRDAEIATLKERIAALKESVAWERGLKDAFYPYQERAVKAEVRAEAAEKKLAEAERNFGMLTDANASITVALNAAEARVRELEAELAQLKALSRLRGS
jgi:hypothetical protein